MGRVWTTLRKLLGRCPVNWKRRGSVVEQQQLIAAADALKAFDEPLGRAESPVTVDVVAS